jgi:uncharacterized membrane protein
MDRVFWLSLSRRFNFLERTLRLITLALAAFIILLLSAPLLVQSDYRCFHYAGTLIYVLADPLCHQLPDRCLFIGQLPMPVCARCLAIYGGALVLCVTVLLKRPVQPWPLKAYGILLSLIILEVIAGKVFALPSSAILRMISGFISGIIIARLVLESIFKMRISTTHG